MSNYDARPYCKAIFALALCEQNFLAWQEALDELAVTACSVQQVADYAAPRQASIDAIIVKFPPVLNLLNILLQNNKLDLLPYIAINFKKLVLEYQNIAEAKAVTAIELNDSQKEQLKKALEERYLVQVLLKYEIDSALIGGVVIYIRDQVIDGSIKTALHCLKQSLE